MHVSHSTLRDTNTHTLMHGTHSTLRHTHTHTHTNARDTLHLETQTHTHTHTLIVSLDLCFSRRTTYFIPQIITVLTYSRVGSSHIYFSCENTHCGVKGSGSVRVGRIARLS